MSQVFSSRVESALTNGFRADLNNYPCGYGGTIPESIANQRCNNSDGRRKSNVRLNDQLIPKPTDINIAEKMIKIAIPKEHPYSSHISRFAMFPSFCSPDDPHTGVRIASQSFLNLSIPKSAPEITLLSKTKGGPYRLESLETPLKTRKKTVMCTGEHGFFDHAKPAKGESQVFYPTPPKTVLLNPELQDWDLTLSERTSNILKNLEKTLWVSSYQMDYADKRLRSNVRRSSCSPTVAELQSTFPTLNQSSASLLLEDKDQLSTELHPKLLPGAEDREWLHGTFNPCIMPRPPVLPGSSSVGTVGKSDTALTVRDLQNSFSKSEAHCKFNSSITNAAVNLGDNVVSGRKHNFFGVNCYYIHG